MNFRQIHEFSFHVSAGENIKVMAMTSLFCERKVTIPRAILWLVMVICGCAASYGIAADAEAVQEPKGGEENLRVVEERRVLLNDVDIYYKVLDDGADETVIFLHGGFGNADVWDPYFDAPQLANFNLLAPDSRGQGRSTIGTGPVTYGRMAGDMLALLDYLGIQSAHFVGHSDGGCILLQLLVDYPDRVKSATLIGTPFHTDNYPAAVYSQLEAFIADLKNPQGPSGMKYKSRYTDLAREPDGWALLVDRLGSTWLSQPSFSDAELSNIWSPVMVIKVDNDQYLPASVFDRTATLIPKSRIHHIAEGTHSVHTEFPKRTSSAIESFINSIPAGR
ncbi:alpha/beta fold hydrolase [Kineobactrum salinum]|uniref:Alpha/beta hydrolase n=1 Tax=Kineobactrum salinum TaxID=2708301 RepID=A0A6C0U759_9GAMM|nr:alpha/beta hydrolase [Kineobactrum salinum]QIB66787.1 alpha/beta hydrolase [Kineobactrum salinum]